MTAQNELMPDVWTEGTRPRLKMTTATTTQRSHTSSIPFKFDSLFNAPSAVGSTEIFEAVFFPLGFPVRIRSNSAVILEAARQSWQCFGPVFLDAPLEITIAVDTAGSSGDELPSAPQFQLRDELFVNYSDRNNFVLTNLANGRAAGMVTRSTVKSLPFLRYHFIEAAALAMIANLRAMALHAACVRWGSVGLLLCGDSGAGKSSLSFACAKAGWDYICDDAAYLPLNRRDRLVVGNAHQVRFRPSAGKLFPEIEGRPITPRAAGKPSIEVPTSEWPHISTAGSATIGHVVFLNREASVKAELVAMNRKAASSWFRQHLLVKTAASGAHEAALERLMGARVFELRYRDMSWAIDRLQQLAEKGW